MAAARLRAVVCTSSLVLGVDWGDVDLVVNVGAPKGASRIVQRIGPRQSPHGRTVEGRARSGEPLRGAGMPRRARRHRRERSGHAAAARRRTRRARPAHSRLRLRRPFRRRRALRRGDPGRALCRAGTREISTLPSISSPPAATRSRPMTALPAYARARMGSGASAIPMWRPATGSTSAPSSKPTC